MPFYVKSDKLLVLLEATNIDQAKQYADANKFNIIVELPIGATSEKDVLGKWVKTNDLWRSTIGSYSLVVSWQSATGGLLAGSDDELF